MCRPQGQRNGDKYSMYTGMFEIMNDPQVWLMLKMAKEKHSEQENEDLLRKFQETDQKQFRELCKAHQFEGMVTAYLQQQGVPLDEEWARLYAGCRRRAEQKLGAAKEVCALMHDNEIDMIVLKNGGIMADMVADPAACPMGDIDSLIHKKDFMKAYTLLMKHGFIFEFSNEYEVPDIDHAYRDGSAEFVKLIAEDHKLVYEVAWRVVAGRWMRPDKEPNTEEFFHRSHYAKDSYIGVLSPEDNLLQVCIHTAKHSYLRAPGLRLNLDVERIVTHCEIDWDLFIERVKASHTKTAAYYSLYLPSVFFDTPVPKRVLDALRPSKRKQQEIERMLQKACFLRPNERKFTKVGFIRFQTALYDGFGDMLHTLYPNTVWMKERYKFSSNLLLPKYTIVRGLDLLGIRKKQIVTTSNKRGGRTD